MKLKSIVLAGLSAGVMASANAFILFPGTNLLEDDNREYLIKGAGNTQAGVLEQGDRLRGVIEFQAINQETAPFSVQDPITPELTGIFETEVVSIIPSATAGIASVIVFGPSASFTSVYGANATVAIFEGGSNLVINSCASIADCETAATDGTHLLTAGFGDVDDAWISLNARLNFGAASSLGSTTPVADISYAQTILVNNSPYIFNQVSLDCQSVGGPFLCAEDGKTDLVGSGRIFGGAGLTNGYGVRSDIDVTINVVPEPGSLALVGLALAGIGLSARRRKA